MSTVAGLFSSDADATRATEALNDAGLGDDLEVINRQQLVDLYPHNVVMDGTQGQPVGVVSDSDADGFNEDMLTVANIQRHLQDRDVDEEEAFYYAQRIQRGDSLLLVEVDDDEADDVLRLMKRLGATQATEE